MRRIREELEEIEYKVLSPLAAKSKETKGRLKAENPCPIRPAFQHDRDRILHSKAFRRLKYKTQVLLLPKGDHYRTRLTHTLEVSQIARTIAKALRLNEDLTEAIALGHDLGHTPFGHAGEAVINALKPGGFRHAEQSLRVVDVLEKKGEGLNLTFEVRDGIRKHSKGKGPIIPEGDEKPVTQEGLVVRIADIIAYLNHDLDDAFRAGVLKEKDIPEEIKKKIGTRYARRIDSMVKDVIYTSLEKNEVYLSEEMEAVMEKLRTFLYERVYESPLMRVEFKKCYYILEALYEYYIEHPDVFMKDAEKSEEEIEKDGGIKIAVCDFIAGMTDRYALRKYEEIFIPKPWMG